MDRRTDQAIIGAVLGGEVAAFGTLLGRYRDAYTRFAVRMLGSRDDADDALQSAFIRAYRSLHKCRERERFGAWLYRIVVNECRSLAIRRGARQQRYVSDEILVETASTEQPDSDAALREEIQRALNRLDDAHREAFVLKHVEELSYEEMAELTGASVSALKMRVVRACRRLREMLEEVHR